jgi:hypothetical protein
MRPTNLINTLAVLRYSSNMEAKMPQLCMNLYIHKAQSSASSRRTSISDPLIQPHASPPLPPKDLAQNKMTSLKIWGGFLSLCLNVHDFEATAKSRLPGAARAHHHSATDSLGALQNDQDDWGKVMLRPRVMRNIRRINSTSSLMGRKLEFPFFVAPVARAALAHDDGEKCLARAAAKAGIGYCVSSLASIPHDEIADA